MAVESFDSLEEFQHFPAKWGHRDHGTSEWMGFPVAERRPMVEGGLSGRCSLPSAACSATMP